MHPHNIGPQFAPLFHGTVHPFKEGDLVTPQGHEPFAYATPNMDYALQRGRDWVNYAWEDGKKVNPTWNTPGGKHFDEFAAETPPRVYEVEPIGHVESAAQDDYEGNVKSRTGFRVIRQVK